MFDARRNGIAVPCPVNPGLLTDGEFDFAFDDRASLRAVRVYGKFHVLQEREEGDKAGF